MNGNNSNKQNNAGCLKSAVFWIVIGVIFFAGELAQEMNGVVFILIAVAAAIAVPVLLAARKKSTAARPSESESSPAEAPQRPMRTSAPAREYYDSDCMRASTGHDHDRRVEQLDAFLEDGLITKEEYAMMQERYERLERNG